MKKFKIQAVAYYRTSSRTNVDGDSLDRQKAAVTHYATRGDIEVVAEFYDAAVSGADSVASRTGFNAMLERLHSNGCKMVLVETASRFARDLAVQLTGHQMLKDHGIELIAVDAPYHFTDDTPTAVMVRQILGAVAEFQKSEMVAKLAGARARKRAADGKCEGRKSLAEKQPVILREAKRLRRANPVSGKRRSYAKVAAELAELGYLAGSGKPHSPSVIQRLVG